MMTNEKSPAMIETTTTIKEEIKMTENMVYETILAILSGEEVAEGSGSCVCRGKDSKAEGRIGKACGRAGRGRGYPS